MHETRRKEDENKRNVGRENECRRERERLKEREREGIIESFRIKEREGVRLEECT